MINSSWINRTPATPNPLHEKLAMFWHGHFATGQSKVQSMLGMMEQNQLFREIGMGDFEPLCQGVSLGGAMIRYLDNDTNRVGRAQENFAYTEFDVVEMARAWTGHGIVGWNAVTRTLDTSYQFRPERHDDTPKTIFGVTRNWDGPETITDICQTTRRDETARFVVTKMWKFFVSPNPSPAAIEEMVSVYKGAGPGGGNLNAREVLRAMLEHPDFWASKRQLVKNPTEFMVDVIRRTGLTMPDNVRWLMSFMGQTLFDPPNVAGWGTNGYWLSTATAWGRGRFANSLRWQLDASVLAELRDGTAAEAAAGIFDFYGIENPSDVSRDQLIAWFNEANAANVGWSIPRNARMIGALLPEFQLA